MQLSRARHIMTSAEEPTQHDLASTKPQLHNCIDTKVGQEAATENQTQSVQISNISAFEAPLPFLRCVVYNEEHAQEPAVRRIYSK